MAIYDKPVHALMKDMVASFELNSGDCFTKHQAIEWFAAHYPKVKHGTIVAHLIRLSTNVPSRLHYNMKPGDDDVLFRVDSQQHRLYEPNSDPRPIHHTSDAPDVSEKNDENDPTTHGASEFAYERDLQNYLAKNLGVIEPGLTLYEDDGINGIEFPAGGRFIDILAVDSNGDLVVIELKVARGYDRVVGQLLRYMGWIRREQASPGQGVRGMVIARNISTDLVYACSSVTDVQLFEYSLALSLKQVATQ